MDRMKPGVHQDDGHEEKGHGHGAVAIKGLSQIEARGLELVSNLHCNACHYIAPELEHGAGHGKGHATIAPDLTFLGDKFRPAWLYDYLRNPAIVRPWLKIRMPDFRLTEVEAVALVNHLSRDMRALSLPPRSRMIASPSERKAFLEAGRRLMSKEYFDCWSCHQKGERKPEGPPENWAPDLEKAGRRLLSGWVVRWLRNPQKMMAGTKMPSFFEDDESGPEDILGGDETKQIFAITEYMAAMAGGAGRKGQGDRAPLSRAGSLDAGKAPDYEEAARRRLRATRARGAQLMSELNCAGCHDVGNMHERLEAAPPLAHEGSIVRKAWLIRFLKKPFRLRPAGVSSGAGARMPDFKLRDEEAHDIAAFLMTRTDPRIHFHENPHAVDQKKAKRGARLFASLRCGTCHVTKKTQKRKVAVRFEGPDLTRAGRRLKEEHLRYWLAGDVRGSGSAMEMDVHPLVSRMGLTKKQIEDLAAYVMTLR